MTRTLTAIAMVVGLGLAACGGTTDTGDNDVVAAVQSDFEMIEGQVNAAGAAGTDAYAVIRSNQGKLAKMAGQDCSTFTNALAALDCQYDAAGAAFMLANVTTLDAEVQEDGAYDPYAKAMGYAADAAVSCQSVSDAGRCAITDEIGRVAPILAELRDLRVAAKVEGARSAEAWDMLKNNMFRISETVDDQWTAAPDLPETGFISAGRKGTACGVVEAAANLSASYDRSYFGADGNPQLSDEQQVAYGGFYQQRQAALLGLAKAVVPVSADAEMPTEEAMREALLDVCAPTSAS